jgi:hypothetical protein
MTHRTDGAAVGTKRNSTVAELSTEGPCEERQGRLITNIIVLHQFVVVELLAAVHESLLAWGQAFCNPFNSVRIQHAV